MDAYQHVKDGTAYPGVLLTAGINDPRVDPSQPAKMAARLQAATSSKKPVLLRVDYDAGHGMGSTRAQHDLEFADEMSFLLWQVRRPRLPARALIDRQWSYFTSRVTSSQPLDAITAFAVPNPNCPSQSRRFFRSGRLAGCPARVITQSTSGHGVRPQLRSFPAWSRCFRRFFR
jgi:hypothetical protein